MATIHLAMDQADGLTLPLGRIVGLSASLQGLRDAGFAAATYTGSRITTVDDAAGDWNDDAVPGWYLTARASATDYALGAVIPPSDVEDVRNAVRAFQAQVIAWSRELDLKAVGQPRAKVDQGHDRLYSALGASFILCRDTNYSINDRKAYATLMRFGSLDVAKVDDFYDRDTGTFIAPTSRGTSETWHTWVDMSQDPVVRVNLLNSVTVTGSIAADVNLLSDWASTITS